MQDLNVPLAKSLNFWLFDLSLKFFTGLKIRHAMTRDLIFSLLLFYLSCSCEAEIDISGSLSANRTDDDFISDEKYGASPSWSLLRQEAAQMREEAQRMRSDAYEALRKAFQTKGEALESREAAFQTRVNMELSLIESLSELKSQAAATALYVQEIRTTLSGVKRRLDDIEDRVENIEASVEDGLGGLDEKLDEKLGALESTLETSVGKLETNKELLFAVKEEVTVNGAMTATIKSRQQVAIEEIRVISLYNMSDQTTVHGGGHHSGFAVDGQFVFSQWAPDTPVRTVAHTSKLANQKLHIDLGGIFKIHRIQIWNSRHCCLERFIGTHIYVDSKLLGVATSGKYMYD